ncbi:hypothetical protein ACFQU7_42120 [Pseudoroseomonas wenyumeiae]
MQLADALAFARSGKALAFLGSGFSLGALSRAGQTIPTTSELARRIMTAAGESEEAEFDLAADLFAKTRADDPTALSRFLTEQFSVQETSNAHKAFSQYPWQRIYTTNYDNIVEVTSRDSGVDRTPVSWQNPPSHYSRDSNWIVHLHGYVGDVNRAGEPKPSFLDDRVTSTLRC